MTEQLLFLHDVSPLHGNSILPDILKNLNCHWTVIIVLLLYLLCYCWFIINLICILDNNECLLGTFVCHTTQTCSNTAGGYECVCATGQTFKDGMCQGKIICVLLLSLYQMLLSFWHSVFCTLHTVFNFYVWWIPGLCIKILFFLKFSLAQKLSINFICIAMQASVDDGVVFAVSSFQ